MGFWNKWSPEGISFVFGSVHRIRCIRISDRFVLSANRKILMGHAWGGKWLQNPNYFNHECEPSHLIKTGSCLYHFYRITHQARWLGGFHGGLVWKKSVGSTSPRISFKKGSSSIWIRMCHVNKPQRDMWLVWPLKFPERFIFHEWAFSHVALNIRFLAPIDPQTKRGMRTTRFLMPW